MSLLADLGGHLAAMVTASGRFASVNRTTEGRIEYPAAHLWLSADTTQGDSPIVARQLEWTVQITSYADDSLVSALELVDAVRDLFAGVSLPGHGHLPVTVPSAKLVEHSLDKGATVYVVTVRTVVFPKKFTLT